MLLHNSYINVAIANTLHYRKKSLRLSGAEKQNSDSLKTHKWAFYWGRNRTIPLLCAVGGVRPVFLAVFSSCQPPSSLEVPLLRTCLADGPGVQSTPPSESPLQTTSSIRCGAGTVGDSTEWPGEWHSPVILKITT